MRIPGFGPSKVRERILYGLSCALCGPLRGRRFKNLKPRRSLRKAAEFAKKSSGQLATTTLQENDGVHALRQKRTLTTEGTGAHRGFCRDGIPGGEAVARE